MASPLLSFIAGAGSGYLGAQRQSMLDDERKADRAQRTQLFDAQMDGINREKKLNLSLADASRPVAVNEGAATLDMGDGPKLYQDSGVANSDMRQARSMGLADVQTPAQTFAVGQKSFADRGAADTEAALQNTPKAVTGRLADAYSAAGQPMAAIGLQNAVIGRDAGRRKEADDIWRQNLGKAMWGGHDALAQLITKTEAGPLAGKTAQSVLSADGKSVTYHQVNEDGTTTPTPYTFSNDYNGVTKAAHLLDSSITPEARYKDYFNERKTAAQIAKESMVFDETKRHNQAVEANSATVARAAATQKPPPGYRSSPTGGLEAIPGGPADPAVKAQVPDKPLNDSQSKALLFGSRMRESDKILGELASAGTSVSMPGATGVLGGVVNAASPENNQRLEQAKRDFINATLRRESGAVIGPSEFESANLQYFAQPFDGPKARAQKDANRKLALDGVLMEVPEKQRNALQPRPATGASASAMPKQQSQLTAGTVYQTSRGPAKWNGKAFEAQ